MRMLVKIEIPNAKFNSLVREGKAGEVISKILETTQPETIYFTEEHGKRGAIMTLDVANSSQIPIIAEPWFLNFDAKCEFRIAMTPQELEASNLNSLGKKWAAA